ncbi:YkvA family protein [Nocardia nova]|uniref:YkvA family protein n=1 Tax=Nocardia nova TaxID=37330 RepID=UPI0037B0A4A2
MSSTRVADERVGAVSFWLALVIGVVAAVVLAWLVLVVALARVRPSNGVLREAMRILPDTVRLIRRLAADRELPRGVRTRLVLLLAYLASPIDLIPDFIPVLGYADDAIIITAVLRSVVRRAGVDAVRAHWPGTDDGFAALAKITGLNGASH